MKTMLKRVLPWKYVVRRIARSFGFIDPVEFAAHLDRFGQPAPVTVPIELLRAGVVFHARGLLNTKAIQYNLDWVWPYWVQKQFNPQDEAFVPRAFSFTHINLAQRNWTALGLPDCNAYPIIDPRGLLTPFFDGWSLDAWLLQDSGRQLLPSKSAVAAQQLSLCDGPRLTTRIEEGDMWLESEAWVAWEGNRPMLKAEYRAGTQTAGWLAMALRPFNPEGVSFVHDISVEDQGRQWRVNGKALVSFSKGFEGHACSGYAMGDVHLGLLDRPQRTSHHCDVGLLTAAALFRMPGKSEERVMVEVDLSEDSRSAPVLPHGAPRPWTEAFVNRCEASLPDPRQQFLFDAARHSLVLLAPRDVYPGPYTYKRFWFRDSAFILNAMLALGLLKRAERVLDDFGKRQRWDGFFLSQDGEWDSNGAALWAYWQYTRLSGESPKQAWRKPIMKGAEWIIRNRCSENLDEPHAGLLPAGFSAEHLGNNDYYYWDDFFAAAGLKGAAELCAAWQDSASSARFQKEAAMVMAAIDRSLALSPIPRARPGIPASPYRRMDAGAIGSLVASYPLALLPEDDEGMCATADFLMDTCLVQGAFFQDMIHSGLNAYLTLMLAQALLRAGDHRFADLVTSVADLASPTGQWPEAIHPRTKGGCMGDGQHLWAAAEWVMMMRNMFVREEEGVLVLASGIPPAWHGQSSRMGPTLTAYGPITVSVRSENGRPVVAWDADWRATAPRLRVALPGCPPCEVEAVPQGRFCPADASEEH